MSEYPLAVIAIRQVEKRTGASRNALEQTAALRELGYRVVILAERGAPDIVRSVGAELVRLHRWPLQGTFSAILVQSPCPRVVSPSSACLADQPWRCGNR
ncbi:hypothetical protein [Kushneria phosphatilytica]|uniref:hypothetical protein n=1 Tax=Kushneria phosphatilytica TaxID=657387 RepID=UPI001F0AEFA8|nr:hypothetical protein [Kushneria phosphatilytica]